MNTRDVAMLPFLKVFAASFLLILFFDYVLVYAFDTHFNWLTPISLLVFPGILTVVKFVSATNRAPSEVERVKLVWASIAVIFVGGLVNTTLKHCINIFRGAYTLLEWGKMLSEGTVRGCIGLCALLLFTFLGCHMFLSFVYGTLAKKVAAIRISRRGR
jgi:hypothetical protein